MDTVYIYADRASQASELACLAKAAGKRCVALAYSADAAAELAECGANEILLLEGKGVRPEDYAKATAKLLKANGASLFLVHSSATGRELAATVAGYLYCTMVSDASKLRYEGNKLYAERMILGGLVCQSEALEGLSVVTVPAGLVEPVSGSASVTTVPAEADTRVAVVGTTPLPKRSAGLTKAERVVCVGNGVAKETDMELIRFLARVLDAEIGCTRGIAEERKWLPVESYIGISGAMLKSKLYLSVGVSGQIQHTYGIRDVKVVVSVNTDDKAPMFEASDYCIKGDLYEIIPALIKAFGS